MSRVLAELSAKSEPKAAEPMASQDDAAETQAMAEARAAQAAADARIREMETRLAEAEASKERERKVRKKHASRPLLVDALYSCRHLRRRPLKSWKL